MVWGSFGKVDLVPFTLSTSTPRLIQSVWKRLYALVLCKNEKDREGRKFVLQEDGAPYLRTKLTKAPKTDSNIKVLEPWPSHSPDLNPEGV